MDLGTGAGLSAFAMADYSHRVLATDPTRPMLLQARRLGLERRLPNLSPSHSVAEALPIASESVDLVTSRVAAHHFTDLAAAVGKAFQLRVGDGDISFSWPCLALRAAKG